MRNLFILYDSECGLCSSARAWTLEQPALLDIEFIAAGSDRARTLFPQLDHEQRRELLVITDEGDVYSGDSAWIMCLYALADYRTWSFRLARPALRPLARRVWHLISTNRHRLSDLLALQDDAAAARQIAAQQEPACELPQRA